MVDSWLNVIRRRYPRWGAPPGTRGGATVRVGARYGRRDGLLAHGPGDRSGPGRQPGVLRRPRATRTSRRCKRSGAQRPRGLRTSRVADPATWPLVEDSWRRILAGPGRNQFILTNHAVAIDGRFAWVTLDENLVDRGGTGTVAATNLYADRGEGCACSPTTAHPFSAAHLSGERRPRQSGWSAAGRAVGRRRGRSDR